MMSNGLRIMVYDKTDTKSFVTTMREALASAEKRLKTGEPARPVDLDIGLSRSWFAGGTLMRALGRFDLVYGASCWEDALEWLLLQEAHRKILELQFWGHGGPGRVWVGNEPLGAHAFAGRHQTLLGGVRDRMTPESLVWLRTCATFGGLPGMEFARLWSFALGCKVAGHTHNIGLVQSGLHSLKPGELYSWEPEEGVEKGTIQNPTKMKGSSIFIDNTIACIQSTIPAGW